MGREGARLTASVLYNVFDAAYRRATMNNPVPFYFIVDEAQEIGSGMRLEAMLSEGAKFGACVFVLTQSLSLMRKVEGMEPVVQALLANSPDEVKSLRNARKNRLTNPIMGNPLLSMPRKVVEYQLSTLNCGFLFDAEFELAWKGITGHSADKTDRLWMYLTR